MVSSIHLSFCGKNAPALESVSFNHPLLDEPREALRGKCESESAHDRAFQWTPAVRAFAALVVGGKLDGRSLKGARHTMAASLDFAITKQPQWIRSVFGVDRYGHSYLRRLVRRTNTERKGGGDVELGLNERQLERNNITIHWNGARVVSEEALARLYTEIVNGYRPLRVVRSTRSGTRPENHGMHSFAANDNDALKEAA